jgi:hypothetical protein
MSKQAVRGAMEEVCIFGVGHTEFVFWLSHTLSTHNKNSVKPLPPHMQNVGETLTINKSLVHVANIYN